MQKLTIHREGHHAEPDPPCCRCRDRCPCPLDRSGRFLQRHPKIANSRFDNKRDNPDLITAKLPALHLYQLAIPASTPPKDSYNPEMARRGEAVVNGAAKCATCRVPPLFSEPGWPMHTAAEIGIDDFQSRRSPDNRYRTTPLRGLFARSKGGFYHDGRFPDLPSVVDHYQRVFRLSLSAQQRADLVEYPKSL